MVEVSFRVEQLIVPVRRIAPIRTPKVNQQVERLVGSRIEPVLIPLVFEGVEFDVDAKSLLPNALQVLRGLLLLSGGRVVGEGQFGQSLAIREAGVGEKLLGFRRILAQGGRLVVARDIWRQNRRRRAEL